MLLANWFEISDQDYIWYKLQGYNIDADTDRVIWLLDGKYHREDGPAYIGSDGSQTWYLHGELHREDGPAVIGADGYQVWWLNGKLHRTDGPAVIRTNGGQEWWLNGEEYIEQEWQNALSELV